MIFFGVGGFVWWGFVVIRGCGFLKLYIERLLGLSFWIGIFFFSSLRIVVGILLFFIKRFRRLGFDMVSEFEEVGLLILEDIN